MSPFTPDASSIERGAAEPVRRQVVDLVIGAIRSGALVAGERLPSSRDVAVSLGVSRSTVVAAFLELEGEGWVEPRPGAGTYVAERRAVPQASAGQPVDQRLPAPDVDLRTGRIDPDLLSSRAWRAAWRIETASAAMSPPEGEPVLLDALARYLSSARGIDTHAGQIVVCTGIGEALLLLTLGLGWVGQPVVVENPGYPLVRSALARAGANVRPVDASEPATMADQIVAVEGARGVYLTPNHQYPLGYRLPRAQRTQLLDWAARTEALIIEDDYNSEYRFGSPPTDVMIGMRDDAAVAYFGTMSKVLDPGLRLAYLRLPERFVEPVRAARRDLGTSIARPVQLVVARLLSSGELSRHAARLRRLYGDRRSAILDALATIPAVREIGGRTAGLHLVAALTPSVDTDTVVAQARERGLIISSLDEYRVTPDPARPALVLSFAQYTPTQLRTAMAVLRDCPALRV